MKKRIDEDKKRKLQGSAEAIKFLCNIAVRNGEKTFEEFMLNLLDCLEDEPEECICGKEEHNEDCAAAYRFCPKHTKTEDGPIHALEEPLEDIREKYKVWDWPDQGKMFKDIDYLLSIIDKQREALEEISDGMAASRMAEIAQEALKPLSKEGDV